MYARNQHIVKLILGYCDFFFFLISLLNTEMKTVLIRNK